MSFIRFNNAEGQASGTTATVANSGGASGYAFDLVVGAITFDNTQFFTGAQSYKIGTSTGERVFWSIPGTPTVLYTRMYFYAGSLPASTVFLTELNNSNSYTPNVSLQHSGILQVQSNASSAMVNGAVTISTGVWYRLETQLVIGNSAVMTYRLYDAAGTLLETVVSNTYATPAINQVYYGFNNISFTGTFWIDEPAVSDQGWIGTATGSSIGPVAKANNAAGGTNGVTVTAANSGGTSGDAFDVITGSPVFSATVLRPSGGWLDYYCGSSQWMQWNLPGNSNDYYSRAYIYMTTSPTTTNTTVTAWFGSQTSLCYFKNGAYGGKLSVGPAGTQGSYVPSVNTWYRVETHLHTGATTAYTEVYVYSLSGSQLDYVITATNLNITAPSYMFLGNGGYADNVYVDSLALSDVTWCGPAAAVPSRTNKQNSGFLDFMG